MELSRIKNVKGQRRFQNYHASNNNLPIVTHSSFREQNNQPEMNIGFAEEIFQQLGMNDEKVQKWSTDVDNVESEEVVCSQYQFDSISQPDTSSISNQKDELSFEFETLSTTSEISQDEIETKNNQEEKKSAGRDNSIIFSGLETISQCLDLSLLSETFSCDTDTDESIVKDENISSNKARGTGDEEIRQKPVEKLAQDDGQKRDSHPEEDTIDQKKPKQGEAKKGLQEPSVLTYETSQVKEQHDTMSKHLNHVKAVMHTNQLLTEGLRNKLLQIWCHMPKNEAEGYQDGEVSEGDSGSLPIYSREESSVSSVCEDEAKSMAKHRRGTLKEPIEKSQCEKTGDHQPETYNTMGLEHGLSHTHAEKKHKTPNIRAVEGSDLIEEKTTTTEKINKRPSEALQNLVTNLECVNVATASETELVVKNLSARQQLVITLKNLESATKELQEYNQRIMLAKGTIEDTAESVKARLLKIQQELREIENANTKLHLQIGKLNNDYSQMQEHHHSVVHENKSLASQCMELQSHLNHTATENEEMVTLVAKLEKKVEVALVSLAGIKMEKRKVEQKYQSLKDNYKNKEEARIAELEKIDKNYTMLSDEIEILRVRSEQEYIDTQNLKQQIDEVKNENQRLQRVTEEEIKSTKAAELGASKWKKQFNQLLTEHRENERQTNIIVQTLRTEITGLKDISRKKDKEMKENMSILENINLDIKILQSNLSRKGPLEKGDFATTTCARRTSRVLSKINTILISMKGLMVPQESNDYCTTVCSGGDTGDEKFRDSKENAHGINMKRRCMKQQKCIESESCMRDTLGHASTSHNSKKDAVQKRIAKKKETCKTLASENVKLHKWVKELTCKVDNFNKIIQLADERLQLNNLQIQRLEKKNTALLVALNKKHTKKLAHKESKSSESLSESSKMGGMINGSTTEQNNHNEGNTCIAKGTCEQLTVGNEESRKQSRNLDNFESEEGVCSLYQLEYNSQPDIGSNSNMRDEATDELETINTDSEISQEEVDNKDIKEEKGDTDFNASSCDTDSEESVPKQGTLILDKKLPGHIEDKNLELVPSDLPTDRGSQKSDSANSTCVQRTSQLLSKVDLLLSSLEGMIECQVKTEEQGSVGGSKPIENNLQMKTVKSSKRKQEHGHQGTLFNLKADTVKRSQVYKLLTAENVELHEHLDEFKNKIDGLNKIIQFADQRLEMFSLQIMRLETKNSALIAALNKKSRKNKETQRQDVNDYWATEECQHSITEKPAKQMLLVD